VKKWEACLYKLGFETEAEAQQNGMAVYMCVYCGKFHRAIPHETKKAHDWNYALHDRQMRRRQIRRVAL
jgi:hypothetical protein